MDSKEFNRLCARYVFPFDVIDDLSDTAETAVIIRVDDRQHKYFDPFNDANHRNEVIEKMQLEVSYSFFNDKWHVSHKIETVFVWDKSMEQAQIKCIEAILELMKGDV